VIAPASGVAPDWLQTPSTVIPAIALISIWQGLGYQVVMFMAGLGNVPKSLLESADIDGASDWQKVRKITIPLLSLTILFLSITGIVGSFQVFNYIYFSFEGHLHLPRSVEQLLPAVDLPDRHPVHPAAVGEPVQGRLRFWLGGLMAATPLAAVPFLIIFIIAQRQIVEGIALSGSKT
jgi:ABC-type glycerol-3-phosphate transport system permease component